MGTTRMNTEARLPTYRKAQLEIRLDPSSETTWPKDVPGEVALLTTWGLSRQPQETFWVVAYDSSLNVRTVVEIARGTPISVDVHVPSIFAAVIACGADRFMIAHNHPSDSVLPSQGDIDVTERIEDAAVVMGLFLEDHLILTPSGKFGSMTKMGYLKPLPYGDEINAPPARIKSKKR